MSTVTRRRVLCVDDHEDSRVMLVNLLRPAFVEAKAVGTAAQALSLIQAEHFDLYVLDGRLPEMDGFELCRRLRAADSQIPILFFSGAAFEADKRKGIAAGANDYVIKPNISKLLESIRQLTSPDVQQPVRREICLCAEARAVSGASDACTPGQIKIPQLRLVSSPSG